MFKQVMRRDITANEKRLICRGIIRADISSLIDGSNTDDVLETIGEQTFPNTGRKEDSYIAQFQQPKVQKTLEYASQVYKGAYKEQYERRQLDDQ